MVAGFAGSGMFQIALAGGPKHVVLIGSESYTASNEYLISSVVGHRLDLVLCRPDVPKTGRRFDNASYQSDFTFDHDREGVFLRSVLAELSERRGTTGDTPRLRPHMSQDAGTTRIERSSIGLRSERGPILLSVMLATGLVAIDSTILATAVPSVVADLGGFSQFPWLFSVYLLATAVTVPLYGKFADLVGRKPMMMLGISIFLVASVLCGFAWSMVSLIVFRALQGLGAGAVLPIGQTIIGDVYSVAERAKVTGYVAGVWAASSVIGPTLGGVFSDYISWRWIFFVNIPSRSPRCSCCTAASTSPSSGKRHRIDYLGAALLAVGGSLLILGLLEGGVELGVGLPRQHRGPVHRPPCCSSRSGTSSRGPPSRSCRCGCSAAGCWSAPTPRRCAWA